MKIAVLGGYAPSLLNFRGPMIARMIAAGHDVRGFAPEEDASVRDGLAKLGASYATVPLQRAGMDPRNDLRTYGAYRSALKDYAPDAVLAYTAKPVVYGLLAAASLDVPLRAAMITGAGAALTGSGSLRQHTVGVALRTLYRLALKRSHVVFFQNPDDEALFRTLGLVGDQRIERIAGSGVDLSHFRAVPLPAGPPTFLMIARLLPDKGVREYAEAARLVRRERGDIRVQLLGPVDRGISADEVRSFEALEYLGETRDVRPYLAAAHAMVLPSYYPEGVPRSLLEALATGRAVITTDMPGCRETVRPGRNGVLVPPRDARALASAMLALAGEEGRLARCAAESRALAEERFDVHKVNEVILDALKRAA